MLDLSVGLCFVVVGDRLVEDHQTLLLHHSDSDPCGRFLDLAWGMSVLHGWNQAL